MRAADPADFPPAGLPGLDPSWSRLIPVVHADGVTRTWHVLDSGAGVVVTGTLLCVHGNPTWSYLWRHLMAAPPAGWRVIAVDQLGMGYSERLDSPRRLDERIADLGALTDSMGLTGPVITVAHDWGGAISLGWALRHREQLAGVVLTNTAVHQPAGSPAPSLIRLARAPGLRQFSCQWTPLFVRTTTALSRPALPAQVRSAFAVPYGSPSRRTSVADFVADIPLDAGHPSAAALASVIEGLPALASVPALLLWGPRDPVFSDRYLRDLMARLPQADVHRFEGASHLVTEDRPESASVIADWVGRLGAVRPGPGTPDAGEVFGLPAGRSSDTALALYETGRSVSFEELAGRIADTAAELAGFGVRHGSRIAMLVPPGVDLTVMIYACWRLGAVAVLADAGLGLTGMGRALRGAGPDFVIAADKGLLAARAMRLPGVAISIGAGRLTERLGRAEHRVGSFPRAVGVVGAAVAADDEAAVIFTSGATGPSKGVVYRHRQLRAQVELLRQTYAITPDDRLVAAFAPFALYAPALGIASAVPDMDVTAPATLTAPALADAIRAIEATMVFAAPAALVNVLRTQDALSQSQRRSLELPRLVLSAGAPVSVALQEQVASLLPNAEIHSPYGMTEALPVTDVELAELRAAVGDGVCVGRPVTGVRVCISPLSADARALAEPSDVVAVLGEICVSAAHVKQRYDRLWATEAATSRDEGWHRTGDVGVLDAGGRLWVQGRLRDVLTTPDGPLTPVPVEQRVQGLAEVRMAALVGVGPVGAQTPVVVVVLAHPVSRGPVSRALAPKRPLSLADPSLARRVRDVAGVELAAVLVTKALPVDIRHNSKIDRRLVAARATGFLSGGVFSGWVLR